LRPKKTRPLREIFSLSKSCRQRYSDRNIGREVMKRIFAGAALAVVLGIMAPSTAVAETILTIDRLVSHVTTVPVIKGDQVNLFVRERVDGKLMKQGSGKPFERKVVLMVHGGFRYALP